MHIYVKRTFRPHFIAIQFETMEPWAFLKRSPKLQEEQQWQQSQHDE